MLSAKRWNSALIAAVLILVAVPSFGKEVIRQARANDLASEYALKDNGDLFRLVNGLKCQVTNHVADFKVSQHPLDAAMIYFIKDENTPNLYVLHNAETTGNCPKTSKRLIQSDIAKKNGEFRYTVVSNTDTEIVNAALSRNGDFSVWNNSAREIFLHDVTDFTMYQKFGVRGVPFSTYALFAINDSGYVLKVKGNKPAASSFDVSERFYSLLEFKAKYKLD